MRRHPFLCIQPLLVILFALPIGACGESGNDLTGPTPVALVVLSPATAELRIGSTVQLSVVITDAGGASLTGRVASWRSSATHVAAVSENGLVTAAGAGVATITASSEGKSGSAAITVTPELPEHATVRLPDTTTIWTDGVGTLRATDANGSVIQPQDLQWTSADPVIAQVDPGGNVTGIAPGQVSVSARSPQSADTTRITVLPLVSLDSGEPHAINAAGVVVGQIHQHAFVWTRADGIRELTGRPGDPTQDAKGIADNGTVAGTSGGGEFTSDHPVVWTFDLNGVSTVKELPWPGGPAGITLAISPGGDRIVGQVLTQPEPTRYDPLPAVWTRGADGNWSVELLPVPEAAFGRAFGVNDRGEVVGMVDAPRSSPPVFSQYISQAVIWTRGMDGSWRRETLETGTLNEVLAESVNASGDVVGTKQGRAVRWVKGASGWTTMQLTTLNGTRTSSARDVNDLGEVVGSRTDAQGRVHPYVWTAAEGMLDLGGLSPQTVGLAFSINNSGAVIGITQEGEKPIIGTLWLGR